MDVGSNMSFRNVQRPSYSLSDLKEPIQKTEQIVRIEIDKLQIAPQEWNFYPQLHEEDFAKLVKSIFEHGLLHPIVVRKEGDNHIILSGHNRVRAFRTIRKELQELLDGTRAEILGIENDENVNPSDFQQIMAVIKEDITDDEAREIIIDANYVQRQLTQKLLTRSVIEKYKIIQERRKQIEDDRYKNMKTREIVAQEFKLSGRHIDRYKKLENLNPKMLEEFYNGKLSLELAAKLSGLKPIVQNHIEEKYLKDVMRYPARTLENLKPSLSKLDIDKIMQDISQNYDFIKLTIKEDGKNKVVTITDAQTIHKIKNLLEIQ